VFKGSVLNPERSVIVLGALLSEFKGLLYADVIVLIAETEEQLVEKIQKWYNVRRRDSRMKLVRQRLCKISNNRKLRKMAMWTSQEMKAK